MQHCWIRILIYIFLFYPRLHGITQFSTLIIIRNVSWAVNQHIRVISDGSCDTEDCSNDAENSALITGTNYIWLNSRIADSLNCNIIYFTVLFTVFFIIKIICILFSTIGALCLKIIDVKFPQKGQILYIGLGDMAENCITISVFHIGRYR